MTHFSTTSFDYNEVSKVLSYLQIFRLFTHGAEPCLRSHQLCSHSRTFQHFMEPEGSVPCSQEPSTGHYPEPYQSSLYDPFSCCPSAHVLVFPVVRSFWLSHQYPICIPLLPHSFYMPRTSHLSFDYNFIFTYHLFYATYMLYCANFPVFSHSFSLTSDLFSSALSSQTSIILALPSTSKRIKAAGIFLIIGQD
jgi:hypothetical protein